MLLYFQQDGAPYLRSVQNWESTDLDNGHLLLFIIIGTRESESTQ